jgi:hypothetical protein
MPSIDITPDQAERLAAVQEELAAEVVGKYGHVRVQDAIEYLLDEHESGGDSAEVTKSAAEAAVVESSVSTDSSDDGDDGDDADAGTDDATGTAAPNPGGSDGDAMLNAMMNLLDTHDDKWGESSGDERYEVTLPDGDVEQVRTKDDVRALLFKHYR